MELNKLKVALVKKILDSENEEELRNVDLLLDPSVPYRLSPTQKAELDRDLADYEAGKGKNRPWADVKAQVRGGRKK
jgi:putative addiction module component (TIGR02574 family)